MISDGHGLGFYGLRLHGMVPDEYCVPAAAGWSDWNVAWSQRSSDSRETFINRTHATLPLLPQGYAEISNDNHETTLHVPGQPTAAALAHPHLAGTAVLAAHWRGELSFHAGGILTPEGVWGVLGDKGSGKSSALAWADQAGLPIWSDDLIVARRGMTVAGPRCVDLRASAHKFFGQGTDIGIVGSRRRWRHTLPPVSAVESRIAGWVTLAWGAHVAARVVSPTERLAKLSANRALQLPVSTLEGWLEVAAVPMLELTRPKDWSHCDEAMELLVTAFTNLN